MVLRVYGLSYKTAPVEVRERISFSSKGLSQGLIRLLGKPAVKEIVILSTCNRVEIYTVEDEASQLNSPARYFSFLFDINENEFNRYLYCYNDIDVVTHLFCVATSLDSMVLGDAQILGQVRQAYETALRLGCTGSVFSNIFKEALKMGSMVRNNTGICKGAVSVSSVSIELAKKVFDDLSDRVVMIIGAGKIAESCVRNLISRNVQKVIVVNRTYARAKELADCFNGVAIPFDQLWVNMLTTDIVVSSTSSPHTIIHREMIDRLMNERAEKPLLLIDLAVPRDIDADIRGMKGVYLYNIDDLSSVSDAHLRERRTDAKIVEAFIKQKLRYFQLYGCHNHKPEECPDVC